MKTYKPLFIAGILSLLASFLHILMIFGGSSWYRFFGAGEGMAQLVERGSSYPAQITSLIAVILLIWALYAFSGAGSIRKLPWLKSVLIVISTIYILRGVFGIPAVFLIDDPYMNELKGKVTFMIITSLISLTLGLLYLKGTVNIFRAEKKAI